MSRALSQSDRDVSADARTGDDAESLAGLRDLLDQSEVLELFDETIRRRFGQMISAAAVKSHR